ncbi:MAG: hypothetical protein WKG01_31010 [Kofleriaceae bacterium]
MSRSGALCVALCLISTGPALAEATASYPASGAVLPPRPSVFVPGPPDRVLSVTSNDRLVPYTVAPTTIPDLVRVDVELASGPLRIAGDGIPGAEYLVATAMPHRLRISREQRLDIASDASMFRIELADGRVLARPSTDSLTLLDETPGRAFAVWSDRSEQLVHSTDVGSEVTPRLRCAYAAMAQPSRGSRPGNNPVAWIGLSALGLLALALQRRSQLPV